MGASWVLPSVTSSTGHSVYSTSIFLSIFQGASACLQLNEYETDPYIL
jgi:hypothetical protein